ncbi:MAG: hypothetical protein KME10_17060 [Plectolyngbya sp. WJT66-NPBG17]|nr:hypothetical protein [Plectolyngbya sp. WJT66-NPBG17]
MGNRIIPLKTVAAPRSPNRSTERKSHTKLSHAKPSGLRFLLHFAQRHPFICLLAVWSSFLFFGWLAVSGLTYTNPAPVEVAQSPVAESKPPSPFEFSKPANTFGLLAIVTASCAVTSVLLARQLRPVKPAPRRAVKRQSAPTPATVRSTRPRQSIEKPPANVKTAIVPKPPTRPSVVTVIIEDENPLEMGDATLADLLDIRQQARG